MAGDAELSHQEDVQIGVQRLRYFERNRNAAARQRKHDGMRLPNRSFHLLR